MLPQSGARSSGWCWFLLPTHPVHHTSKATPSQVGTEKALLRHTLSCKEGVWFTSHAKFRGRKLAINCWKRLLVQELPLQGTSAGVWNISARTMRGGSLLLLHYYVTPSRSCLPRRLPQGGGTLTPPTHQVPLLREFGVSWLQEDISLRPALCHLLFQPVHLRHWQEREDTYSHVAAS